MISIGSIVQEPSTSTTNGYVANLKSNTMPAISQHLTNSLDRNGHIAKIRIDHFYDDEPETFMDDSYEDDDAFSDNGKHTQYQKHKWAKGQDNSKKWWGRSLF